MGKTDVEMSAVIQGYSDSLLAVARSEGCLDQVESELSELKDALAQNSDLLSFLKNPKITGEGKRKAISEILGNEVSKITHFQIGLAIEQGRGGFLPKIIEAFFQSSATSRKKITAKVVTAIPLTDEMEQKLEGSLTELAGEAVFLKKSVDPSLLGGVVIQLGERIIDGSLKGRLDRLRTGISRKILTEKGRTVEDKTG